MGDRDIENREITWEVIEDLPVNGTITAPVERVAPLPAVILLAGSGPTDRNWCSPLLPGENGSGKLLAEALARRGFLTLRYDKVGSGPHVRENLPKFAGKIDMQSFRKELAGAIETVVSEDNVDRDRLFALTNSEGAIHAVNYQLQAKGNRLRGMVLTGAPGRAIGQVSRDQIVYQMKSLPDAEAILDSYDAAVSEFIAGRQMNPDPALPEGIRLLLRALESPNNLPFSRELWVYSLPEYISMLDVPTLIVIGKKDLQTNWRADGGALEAATAGKGKVSFVYPEDANHVLKHEDKPIEELTAEYVGAHYNAPDAVLDGEASRAIYGWLDRQTQP
jgi:uncharacterized protein